MNTQINEILKMVDTLLNIVNIDMTDEVTRQVLASYIFGLLNGKAYEETSTPTDIQAIMIRLCMEKLNYSTEESVELTQFLIEATDKNFHPTMNAIIHRGISAYFFYAEGQYNKVRDDFQNIIDTILSKS
ncbi:Imm48 family immunity protein [Streptococcus acidominimus]|uniref:Uncharacterized protein n=1 Tax=Streptococcus acidominimus TaxID=1326 RepID=A0A4Y9FLU0_STRAI|nr:Imm48 family immunity protein [Streptococcus acidominimus]MBF0819482.1 hypothetical protein [Streptococcus acidominimus]MBF0838618.1 hypothetical protein [Streptococcus acidominimus]MBF0846724.1 hypothetical protein [Streptococcus danieliae]TFU29812.1 hypothetical protein E4U01_08510 [Streptococcus acidominimus]